MATKKPTKDATKGKKPGAKKAPSKAGKAAGGSPLPDASAGGRPEKLFYPIKLGVSAEALAELSGMALFIDLRDLDESQRTAAQRAIDEFIKGMKVDLAVAVAKIPFP